MNKLLQLITESNSISVTSHVSPDGDSIGSILALGLALKQRCSHVDIFINDELPKKFTFLDSYNYIRAYNEIRDNDYDICFVLDCGDRDRLGNSIDVLKNSKFVINIDHHVSNTRFGHINILDTAASSTCEIIYSIIEDLGLRIDKEIATCLYTGIVTDSGNFIYDNADDKTHIIAASLLRYNIDKQNIVYNLYQNKTVNNVKFLGYALSNIEFKFDNRLAILALPYKLIESFNITNDDMDGVVNYGRNVDQVDISVTLKEDINGDIKLSFRSKDDRIDVRLLAEKFGGGGHQKAAGATLTSHSLEDAKHLILKEVKQFLSW